MPEDFLIQIRALLCRIEEKIDALTLGRGSKSRFSTAEFAAIVDKAPFTVREWCRRGRINAAKRACGRGSAGEWTISVDELERFRNEGLLPEARTYRHPR